MSARLSLAGAMAVVFASLSSLTMSDAIAAEDVKVGILCRSPGPWRPIGQNNRRGHELAIDEINAAGGIKSLGGAKLVMIDGDTQGNPKIGIQETEKLAPRASSAIMGAYQSNVTFPTTQIAGKTRECPTSIRGHRRQHHRRPQFQIHVQGCAKGILVCARSARVHQMARREIRKAGQKRIVLMYEDTLFGQSTSKGQEATAKEFGIEVVGKDRLPGRERRT